MKILYPAIYFLAAKAQITPPSPPSKQLDSNLDSQKKTLDLPCHPYIPITVMGHEVVPSCADQEPLPEGDASSFDNHVNNMYHLQRLAMNYSQNAIQHLYLLRITSKIH